LIEGVAADIGQNARLFNPQLLLRLRAIIAVITLAV
jgi:hypothetical protein